MVEKEYFYSISQQKNIPPMQFNAVNCNRYIDYKMALHVCSQAANIRKTGIMCTIGSSSESADMLKSMIECGMNIVRINGGFDTIDTYTTYIKNLKEAVENYDKTHDLPKTVGIAFELRGPEIRTGSIHGENEIELKQGAIFRLTTDKVYADKGSHLMVYVDYDILHKVVQHGDFIYIDSARLKLKVTEVQGGTILTEVVIGGTLRHRKQCHVPGVQLDLPYVTEKDKNDLAFVAACTDIDALIISKVRDVTMVKDVCGYLGERRKDLLVFAKIENQQGVDEIDYIMKACDGIIIGRRQLGLELPLEKLFLIQKSIISRCNKNAKPVMCMSEMLDSMVTHLRPTRGETNDIANAILDGADSISLVRETATGLFVCEAVTAAANICLEAEAAVWQKSVFNDLKRNPSSRVDVTLLTAIAAVDAARRCRASGIAVLTTTGQSAYMISSFRPSCPVLAITRSLRTAKKCNFFRAVVPIFYNRPRHGEWEIDTSARFEFGIQYGKDMGFMKPGDAVVVIKGYKVGSGSTNTMRVYFINTGNTFLPKSHRHASSMKTTFSRH